MIEAVIFDFDGVIFNSEPLHFEASNTVFKELGFIIHYDEYLTHYVGLSDKEMFPKILSKHDIKLDQNEINHLIHQKTEAFSHIVSASQTLEATMGIQPFLKSISLKVSKIAICSGATKKEIDIALSKLDNGSLRKYFQMIISADDVTQGKPSPEGYLLTANQLQVEPEKCIVIEDTPNGIKAAKAANMHVIALLTTHQQKNLLPADIHVNDFSQLSLALLQKNFNLI